MDVSEIRDLPPEELAGRIEDQREELFKLRFQIAVGQVTDTSRLQKARRALARLLTVQRERQLVAVFEGNEEAE